VVRAQEAGGVHPSRGVETVVFSFHSACQGLASSELAAVPSPEGPGFWPMLARHDLREVWTTTLQALVTGLGAAPAGEA
jgi:hypothetical protein